MTPPVLAAPVKLSETEYRLFWTDAEGIGVKRWQVERAPSADGPWTERKKLPANTRTYKDIVSTIGTVKYWRIRVLQDGPDTVVSNVVTNFVALPPPPPPPPPPAGPKPPEFQRLPVGGEDVHQRIMFSTPGSVSVRYQVDGGLPVDSSGSAPYQADLCGLSPGAHVLTAIAIDSQTGAKSAPANINWTQTAPRTSTRHLELHTLTVLPGSLRAATLFTGIDNRIAVLHQESASALRVSHVSPTDGSVTSVDLATGMAPNAWTIVADKVWLLEQGPQLTAYSLVTGNAVDAGPALLPGGLQPGAMLTTRSGALVAIWSQDDGGPPFSYAFRVAVRTSSGVWIGPKDVGLFGVGAVNLIEHPETGTVWALCGIDLGANRVRLVQINPETGEVGRPQILVWNTADGERGSVAPCHEIVQPIALTDFARKRIWGTWPNDDGHYWSWDYLWAVNQARPTLVELPLDPNGRWLADGRQVQTPGIVRLSGAIPEDCSRIFQQPLVLTPEGIPVVAYRPLNGTPSCDPRVAGSTPDRQAWINAFPEIFVRALLDDGWTERVMLGTPAASRDVIGYALAAPVFALPTTNGIVVVYARIGAGT